MTQPFERASIDSSEPKVGSEVDGRPDVALPISIPYVYTFGFWVG